MSERAPYSRVYWSVMDDVKFDGIREDVRLFGSWSLLLVVADMAHPAPAYLPRTIPKVALDKLSEAGLIDLLQGHRFRVRGLDAERERRRTAATNRGPNGSRVGTKREANGEQDETKTRRDEQRQDETDGRADLEAFLLVTRRAPTVKQRRLLDSILEARDVSGPQWAADIILANPDDPIGAVLEADKAWRDERIAEARRIERPKPVPHRRPGMPQATRELLDHWAAQAKETA